MKRIRLPRMVTGCLVLIIAIVVCGGTLTFALDRICYSNLSQRLPIYPNATIQTRAHNLFDEFGMGSTVIVLTSPDTPETIRTWYGVHAGEYLRAANQNSIPFARLAQGNVDVEPGDDGTSSQIFLYGKCAD